MKTGGVHCRTERAQPLVASHQQRLVGPPASTIHCSQQRFHRLTSDQAHSCPLPRQPTWFPATCLCTAADVEQVAAALGLHRLLVVGSSVGATYALALAAYLPDRVQATLLISPSGSTGQQTGRP